MAAPHDNLHAALRAVAAGDFDALTPEQVAQLERALNENPQVAALVADAVPAPDARLAAGLAELERAALPSDQAWDQAWKRIDATAARAAARTRQPVAGRIIRLWKPLLAAAACIILAAVWRIHQTPQADTGAMQLATNVEIDDLEVGDDATPLIIESGGVNVIWVLQDET